MTYLIWVGDIVVVGHSHGNVVGDWDLIGVGDIVVMGDGNLDVVGDGDSHVVGDWDSHGVGDWVGDGVWLGDVHWGESREITG